MAQYLKPECELGYVEDSSEIENLKFNNSRHVVLGCMLGDFDEVGNYIVSEEIVDELISMEKYLVNTYDNIELCKSALKLDKQISFMVTYEGNKATLSLVEKLNYEANFALNSGTYSNINECVLDVVETSGEVNRNVLYDRWNIKTVPGQIIDIFNCDPAILEKFFGIVNRFKYLLATNKILLEKEEQLEEAEASYSNNMLDILKHYPMLNIEVMSTIKQLLEERKNLVSVKKPYFAKTFNEVLESATASNLSKLDEIQRAEFEKEKRNALNNLAIKRQDVLEIERLQLDETNESSPKVLKIKTNQISESRSLEELGSEFVSTHKTVSSNISNDEPIVVPFLIQRAIMALGEKNGQNVELPTSSKDEKNKLISTLVGAGLGVAIGGVAGATVGAVAGAVAAEVVNKTAPATVKPTKREENNNVKTQKNKGGSGTGRRTTKRTNGNNGSNEKSNNTNKRENKEGQQQPVKTYSSGFYNAFVGESTPTVKEEPRFKLKPTAEVQVSRINLSVKKEETGIKRATGNIANNSVEIEFDVSGIDLNS